MKILFDHQIFEMQKFGGISRYFSELLEHFEKETDVEVQLSITHSNNEYLKRLEACNELLGLSQPLTYDRFLWGATFLGKAKLYQLLENRIKASLHRNLKVNQESTIKKIKEGNFDIFHPTYYDNYFLDYLENKPFVLTVHDLIHQIFPEFGLYEKKDKDLNLLNRASKIIAVSESTKSDLVSIFDIEPEKITVTHLANSLSGEGAKVSEEFREKYSKRYILFVGGRADYKNFLFFTYVFAALTDKEIAVICTGSSFNKDELYLFNKLGVSERMHHTYVTDNELTWLYENALAFVFPSLYEGFGLPVLEAFSCGCPVVASYSSSLIEIGEDAVTYFQPKNSVSMRNAIESVINDQDLRKTKIRKGYSQLQKFSWSKTSTETIKIYKQILTHN